MWKVRFLASGSKGNCAVVSDGDTNIMIDVGVRPEGILKSISVKDVDAIFVTHSHFDHLKYAYKLSERYQIPVYALQETLNVCFGTLQNESNINSVTHLAKPVRGGERLTIGNIQLIPIELKHDVPCIGLYMRNQYKETLLWVSDTSEIPVDIEADVYVIEANYDEETLDERGQAGEVEIGVYGRLISDWGHLSLQSTSRYVQKNAKPDSQIILQHCSQSGNLNMNRIEEVMGRPVLITPAEFEWGAKCPF